jgi:hypothetical protein
MKILEIAKKFPKEEKYSFMSQSNNNNQDNQDKNSFSEKKEEISHQHRQVADKCGKALIEIGESLQKNNHADDLDKKVGKSLVDRGRKILNYADIEAKQVERAKQEKNSSFDYHELAAQQRRKATEEHTQAIKEYQQLLQQKIDGD